MLLKRFNLCLVLKQSNIRYFTANSRNNSIEKIDAIDHKFFMNMLGISSRKWENVLKKHTKFVLLEKEDIVESFNTLKELKLIDDIEDYPGVLTTSTFTIKNRMQVFQECCFKEVTLKVLHKYISLMKRPIGLVKTYGYIPPYVNVAENLAKEIFVKHSSPEAMRIEERGSLSDLRKYFIDIFLKQELEVSDGDLQRIWHTYGRLRHKALKIIAENLYLIRNEMNFSNEKILKHIYLLYAEPDNIRSILTIEKFAGVNSKEVLERHPSIFLINKRSIEQIFNIFRENGIPESAFHKNWLLLTLGVQTVASRIAYLKQTDEFRVLLSHPRIGRLIFMQNKAIHRLNYLKDNKMFCASLNVLSTDTRAFQRFAQNGFDATKGKEIIIMMSEKMKRSQKEIKKYMSRHPNWCHVPLVTTITVYNYLIEKGYTNDDIFENIHIILYPLTEIKRKTEAIERGSLDFAKELDWRTLTKSQFLALVLYSIELNFHFTGDGLWSASRYTQAESVVPVKHEEVPKYEKIQ
ncbi:Transcription termination factor 5, mitochondrial [Sergentomyia squamirostris]